MDDTSGNVSRRVRRSAEQWARLIDAQRRSGLSIVAFCPERGLAASSFHRWRRRLAGSMGSGSTDSRSAERSFVRLRVSGGDAAVGASSAVNTPSPSSAVVRFVDGVELCVGGERLAELVTLLRRDPPPEAPPPEPSPPPGALPGAPNNLTGRGAP